VLGLSGGEVGGVTEAEGLPVRDAVGLIPAGGAGSAN